MNEKFEGNLVGNKSELNYIEVKYFYRGWYFEFEICRNWGCRKYV